MVNQQDLKPLWLHAEAIIIPLALDQFFVGLVNTWHLSPNCAPDIPSKH